MTDKRRKRKRSKGSWFAPALLSLSALFNLAVTTDYNIDHQAFDSDDTEAMLVQEAWTSHVLQDDSRPYDYLNKDGDFKARKGAADTTIAIQLEGSSLEVNELLLSPLSSPYSIFKRHGQAATAILNNAADDLAGSDVDVRFVERAESIDDWIFDANSSYAQALFGNADVLSLSMSVSVPGDDERLYSAGNIDSEAEIRNADDFWQRSETIFVWSAGNYGDEEDIGIERPFAAHTMRADTMLRVGSARDGLVSRVDDFSSRAGASFVCENPFRTGFAYPYYHDEESLRTRVKEFFALEVESTGKTVGEMFNERSGGLYKPRYFFGIPLDWNPLYDFDEVDNCHPDFENAEFEGKAYLLKSQEWRRQNPDLVREAYIEGLVSGLLYRKDIFADDDGLVDGINGTSFTAPYAAGMVAAMHKKYPQLSEYDLVAGALMACRRIPYVEANDGSGDWRKLSYNDNGRGMIYDSVIAGFGILRPEAYQTAMAFMAERQAGSPDLKTKKLTIETDYMTFTHPDDETDFGIKTYNMAVTDDIVSLRTNLALRFKDKNAHVPPVITLISPAGGEVSIAPTCLKDGRMDYSLATTDGHFGNYTAGIWSIRVPDGFQLEEACLTIHGMQKGGLVDECLNGWVDVPVIVPENDGGKSMPSGSSGKNKEKRPPRKSEGLYQPRVYIP